MTSKQDPSWAK